MAAQTPESPEFDLKQAILFDGTFGPKETERLAQAVSGADPQIFDSLREAVGELEDKESRDELSPAGRVRLGVGFYLTGRYDKAADKLRKGDSGALALFYLAKSCFALQEYDQALKYYDQSQKAGYGKDACALGRAEIHRYKNEPEKALAELDALSGAVEQTAEYLYQRGATIAQLGVNPNEAVALYERAVSVDRTHPGALFGLAQETERRGNDEEALELYRSAVKSFPANVGTLFNLGLLYEDLEQYEQAIGCYQRVLDSFHIYEAGKYPAYEESVKRVRNRASLFLKDAIASSEMHFDEEAARRRDQISRVLSVPVSDLEFNNRVRDVLRTLKINTLGDLCALSEQELMSAKNFGETSLIEIKEQLSLKGLKLGQFAEEKLEPEPAETETLTADEQAVLSRPVTDLNLKVRHRKCMTRLNIQTIGELVRKTPSDLLKCKNFGVSSLTEISDLLAEFHLKLRGE